MSNVASLELCKELYELSGWVAVKDYEGFYEVNTLGQVRSLGGRRGTSGKILKGTNFRGYRKVSLCVRQKRKTMQVHRLVAIAFIPNPDNRPHINHKDGNPSNNVVSNLEWCTHQENMTHSWKTGLNKHTGVNHTQHKLNENEVRYIKAQMVRSGVKAKKLALRFKVSPTSIYDIWQGRTWKNT